MKLLKGLGLAVVLTLLLPFITAVFVIAYILGCAEAVEKNLEEKNNG